jgi:uncharacterized protein (TIGR03437 family)
MDWKRYVFILGAAAATLQAAPQLQLTTTALGPINIGQGANGPTQTVGANNLGSGTLSLSATASSAWLQPSISQGSVQIALNTASLAPGSYTEFVTVTAPGAVDAPQNISVTIQVAGVPSSLTFYAAPGSASTTQQVVTQAKPASVQSSTLSGSGWLSVSLSGQGSFASFLPYLVTVNPQSLPAVGDYAGTVAFSGSAVATDNKQTSVTVHLTSSPIQQFNPAAVQLISGGTIKTSTAVSILNAGQGTISITGATGSAAWLTAAVSGSTMTVTADPSGMSAGTYQGTVTVASNAANATATTLPVEFVVQPSAAPILSFHGVVDNATFGPTLSPGMIAQAYGVLLSGTTPAVASSLPLSNSLGGVQVTVNGISAPVYYASSGVIDFVVPFAVQPGPATVSLSYNGVASNSVSTTIAARAPRILYFQLNTVNGQTFNYGIMINSSDGSYPVPMTTGLFSHPAKRGDTVTIYLLGMGSTDQNVADGAPSPASPLANTPTPTVIFGGGFAPSATDAKVLFSGLAPGFVGLYQLNVTIPADAPLGDAVAMEIQVAGATSNPVYLAISN